MPKISVIIPIYNAEEYLKECLDSVIGQTLKDIEILCIDDGSPDNSLNILKEYANKDTRIKIIEQKNQGSGPARNNGIKSAQGDYIVFMDPDDIYPEKDILEALYEKVIENDVYIAGGRLMEFVGKENFNRSLKLTYSKRWSFEKEGIINYRDFQYEFGYTRYIYNRQFLVDNEIFFPNFRRFQDSSFFIRAMLKAERFYAFKKCVYAYRKCHKKVKLNPKTVIDTINGIKNNMIFSKENHLDKLYLSAICNLNYTYYKTINPHLDNPDILAALKEALNLIDENFFEENYRNNNIKQYCYLGGISLFHKLFSIRGFFQYKIMTVCGIKFRLGKEKNDE